MRSTIVRKLSGKRKSVKKRKTTLREERIVGRNVRRKEMLRMGYLL